MIRRIQAIMRSYLVKNAPPKERKSEIMPNQSNTIQIKNQEVGELKNDDNIDGNRSIHLANFYDGCAKSYVLKICLVNDEI